MNTIYTPLDLQEISTYGEQQRLRGRRMIKVGFTAAILDGRDRLLVLAHEGRDGQFPPGALGPLMETFRFVHGERIRTETPAETLQRGLREELDIDRGKFEQARPCLDRPQPLRHGEWRQGSTFSWAANLMLRASGPDVLVHTDRPSEEILSSEFMSFDDLRRTKEPKRPGFDGWLAEISTRLEEPFEQVLAQPIEWRQPPPSTGRDVYFPYEI